MRFQQASAALSLASVASAQVYQGFNYGSTFTTGAAKQQSDFEYEFNAAKGLVGHSGFTSARLYTMIQAGTASTPISAIPAAIASKTTLLLGLWGSAGQAFMDTEIAALKQAITTYGDAFTSLIAGISVGSEDLYRITPTGIANKAGVGANPDQIASYINQVRGNISLSVPIGHVDTWTAWVNGSNSAVIAASDFLGVDSYPYFQTVNENSIENGASLFFQSYDATVAVAQGKPVWVTESGWPVSGPTENLGVASVANAKTYWDQVACKLLGTTSTWWYTLQDAQPDTPSPSFGLVGAGDLGTNPKPLFDLTCPSGSSGTSSSSSSAVKSSTSVASVPSGTASSVSLVSTPTSIVGTPSGSDGPVTSTIKSTVWSTVTACPTDGNYDVTVTVKSTAYVTACPECQASTTPISTGSPAPAPTPSPSATSSACPADLSGTYQYPHLIVPVDKSQPTKAYGTSYFGYINSTVSTIFNFDIPQSYAGQTCTLVFLFPLKSQLETTDYTLTGSGGLTITGLQSPATEQTTYANQPASAGTVGTIASLTPGNSYVVTSGACPAGQRIAYEISATGSLDLSYFEDWNPSPLGLFIRTC